VYGVVFLPFNLKKKKGGPTTPFALLLLGYLLDAQFERKSVLA
jgi:hypothetical protein